MKGVCSKCNQYKPTHWIAKDRCGDCCQHLETKSANDAATKFNRYAARKQLEREQRQLKEKYK